MLVCVDKVVLAETQYSCHIVSLLIPREGSDNMTEWLGTNSCSCLDNFPAGQRRLCLRNRDRTVMTMAALFLDHPRTSLKNLQLPHALRTFQYLGQKRAVIYSPHRFKPVYDDSSTASKRAENHHKNSQIYIFSKSFKVMQCGKDQNLNINHIWPQHMREQMVFLI